MPARLAPGIKQLRLNSPFMQKNGRMERTLGCTDALSAPSWRADAWLFPVHARVMAVTAAAPLVPTEGHSFWSKLTGMPVGMQLAFGIGLLLVLIFIYYIWMVINRELNDRTIIRPARRHKNGSGKAPRGRVGSSAWVGADVARGARELDVPPTHWADDDLPPITMVDGRWVEKSDGRPPRQADLVAGASAGQAEADSENPGVYRTGINPFFNSTSQGIEVEEVANIETQAELMAHLGEYDTAVGLLTRHIRDTERPAPKAWLMLFDLYTKTGREEQYKNLGKGFRILFNADVPPWEEQRAGVQRDLEQYPRVVEKVQRLWGMPTCKAFLESLIYDDRGGDRQGFMLAAYDDIIFLLDIIEAFDHIMAAEEDRRLIESKLLDDRRA